MHRFKTNLLVTTILMGAACYAHEPADSLKKGWRFKANVFYYLVDGKDPVSPIVTTDHNKLHLEGRYNYEALNTVSAFIGSHFKFGQAFQLQLTPMAGLLMGDLYGAAPGLEITALYRKFDYYAESEYIFSFEDQADDFFYSWGELAYNPTDAIRFGMSYQKSRLYHTGRTVQWGPFAQYAFWKLRAGIYYFNPLASSDVLVFVLGVDF